ncbi:hypothetical protein [Treponema pedis]|uniref:hypothetical protein n=1 Tax=Treponema pedis TaxID=409322 RepID=UPI000422B8E9
MKSNYLLKQVTYLIRTAIEAEILFAVCLSKCGFWSGSVNACVKTPPEKAHAVKRLEQYWCSKPIDAASKQARCRYLFTFIFCAIIKAIRKLQDS